MNNESHFNPLEHPIIFMHPTRITSSSWLSHVPFAMYLIEILQPKVVAELGAFAGVSYCAFCQAVSSLNLVASCFAIDSWEGDHQGGYYGAEVLAELRQFHDPRYGHFSKLIQSTFEDAIHRFEDSSIDLLHIDGCHTYEAARADFESWLPKMSGRGVVLFHDIAERSADFGVWQLWEELKPGYPTFEFHHGHGLGVLASGPDSAPLLGELLSASEAEAGTIRDFFQQLGTRLEFEQESGQLRLISNDQVEAINWLQEQTKEYQELYNSPAVKLTRSWHKRGFIGTVKRILGQDETA